MLSAWRGFYRYLARDHGYGDNPCLGLRAPRPRSVCRTHCRPTKRRGCSISKPTARSPCATRRCSSFSIRPACGCPELTGLAPADVNFADGTVRVTGKGSKTRIVPVGRHALDALGTWLTTRAQVPAHEADALFVNRLGRRLGPRSVQQRLKTWALKQGVSTNVHPHVLRHSFASHVLQSSGDLRAVQEMLGHASISTTQVYTHLDFQHLAKVYDAAHPRAKRRKVSCSSQDTERQVLQAPLPQPNPGRKKKKTNAKPVGRVALAPAAVKPAKCQVHKLILKPGREKSLKRRHPWIFSGAIAKSKASPNRARRSKCARAMARCSRSRLTARIRRSARERGRGPNATSRRAFSRSASKTRLRRARRSASTKRAMRCASCMPNRTGCPASSPTAMAIPSSCRS